MNSVDLSIILSTSRGGRTAHPALRALFASVNRLGREQSVATEVILVTGPDDQDAVDYAAEHWPGEVTILSIASPDRGDQWRSGLNDCNGKQVCLMDATDQVGQSWLSAAWRCLEEIPADAIGHPEWLLEFGAQQKARRQQSSTDEDFARHELFHRSPWHHLVFARRDLLLQFPYQPVDHSNPEAAGDWKFAADTLAEGIVHVAVPGTCCFVRRQEQRALEPLEARAIAGYSRFFDLEFEAAPIPQDDEEAQEAPPPTSPRATRVLKALYRPIYKTIKPLAVRHPRLNRLGVQIANAIRDFAAKDETLGDGRAATASSDGAEHVPTQAGRFPPWLIQEWHAAHEFEPDLFPEEWLLQEWAIAQPEYPDLSERYRQLRTALGEDLSHLMLAPWIRTGGADLTALNYLQALMNRGLAGRVTVLCTLDAHSEWRDRVPDGVRFVEFGAGDLDDHSREILLARLLLQIAPHSVHTVNSELGWAVFAKYGSILRRSSKLYASTFCTDLAPSGRAAGYPVTYYRHCFEHLTALFFDSHAHLNELVQRFAFDRSKMHVHYQPAQEGRPVASRQESSGSTGLQILWAGRLDRQKRPDLLLRIAETCRDLPVHFHVYGISVLDGDYEASLRGHENLTLHGAYNGFKSLPIEQFDLYLYTSQWDGLPNVLSESATAELPILAGDTGGISEFIRDGETGFLVSPYHDVESFAAKIRSILRDRDALKRVATGAKVLVSTRHSWPSFMSDLDEATGYLHTP